MQPSATAQLLYSRASFKSSIYNSILPFDRPRKPRPYYKHGISHMLFPHRQRGFRGLRRTARGQWAPWQSSQGPWVPGVFVIHPCQGSVAIKKEVLLPCFRGSPFLYLGHTSWPLRDGLHMPERGNQISERSLAREEPCL